MASSSLPKNEFSYNYCLHTTCKHFSHTYTHTHHTHTHHTHTHHTHTHHTHTTHTPHTRAYSLTLFWLHKQLCFTLSFRLKQQRAPEILCIIMQAHIKTQTLAHVYTYIHILYLHKMIIIIHLPYTSTHNTTQYYMHICMCGCCQSVCVCMNVCVFIHMQHTKAWIKGWVVCVYP